ncbi:MAG: Bis-ABC ATPase Uup [uncultured Thermoleophilia bacterium]|uniref:Bis-ABC ATPase Uup n=1 Tax=uncultured Thermoleophilia bacterium TaxID=1497501 RepID=A0A6J4UK39_9ACTN|nr:MAG: Bis-ABC ATPase Uup [uncultured Thermoleophilia bacterium]
MAVPPRNLVSAEGVRQAYAGRVLLDGVSLGVADGDRIGVVGRNGGGKSTLLRLLARRAEPDAGTVTHRQGLTVGLLDQADELEPDQTIRQLVIGGRADHEWQGDRRIRDVLDGLLGGVELTRFPQGLDTPVGPLSGGERRRLALARLLLDAPGLLLLDEPTNHLDVEGVDWLARHLAARRGSLVVVTHDRWFLDAVVSSTWEVDEGTVHAYEGGYAAWVLARAERERQAAATAERRRNLLRKELAWLRRGPPARTAKPRFRIEAANQLIADEPELRNRAELLRFASARLGRSVYDVEGVTAEIGGRVLLRRVTWRLGPGDRVGVVGVNGAGKTTFLRLLLGRLAPTEGTVRVGTTVRVASLSQDVEELDPALRVLEALRQVRVRIDLGGGRELTAGQLAERFGFVGPRAHAYVRDLSGGERRRLQLMRLLMDEPNVLLLDEPTNDLDIDTLTALEDLLDGWAGSLVVVSHDRFFLERTCDDVHGLLGDGRIRHLPGGVDQYLELRRSAPVADVVAPAPPRAAPEAVPRGAAVRQARKEVQRLERELHRVERRSAEVHEAMARHATDYGRVATLDRELRALAAERERLEEGWLEAADAAGD